MYGTQLLKLSPPPFGTSLARLKLGPVTPTMGAPDLSRTLKSTVTLPEESAVAPVIVASTMYFPAARSAACSAASPWKFSICTPSPFLPGVPESPLKPESPFSPGGPASPAGPPSPFSPGGPASPEIPGGPASPLVPFFPALPSAPSEPEHAVSTSTKPRQTPWMSCRYMSPPRGNCRGKQKPCANSSAENRQL